MKEVKSSNIHAIDHEDGTLKIQFKDKTGAPGATYHYPDVPASVHADLMAAESHGKHFLAHIRNQFKGEKQ